MVTYGNRWKEEVWYSDAWEWMCLCMEWVRVVGCSPRGCVVPGRLGVGVSVYGVGEGGRLQSSASLLSSC